MSNGMKINKFSTVTCCKLLPTAKIVTDVWFVSGVGTLVYLQDTQTKVCSSEAGNHIADHAVRRMLSLNNSTFCVGANNHKTPTKHPHSLLDGVPWCKAFHSPRIHSGKTSRLHLSPFLVCCLDPATQSERTINWTFLSNLDEG